MGKPKEKFTVVAFRYDQKQSVFYNNTPHEHTVGVWVERCLKERNADVISIRRVYEERPTPQKKTS